MKHLLEYPFPSQRTALCGKQMAAASTPSVAKAGITVLDAGGNAVDAAVAMAAAATVVEPTSNGLGSDLFAIVAKDEKLWGLNASGKSPRSMSIEALKERGWDELPHQGVAPVTTPGAVSGWMALTEKLGRRTLAENLAPAIALAREGFHLSPTVARLWEKAHESFLPFKGEEAFQGLFQTFFPRGVPRAGELVALPEMARSLELIAASNGQSFYQGELAGEIHRFMEAHGGFLSLEDLRDHSPLWVEPLSVNYRGVTVHELPPNGHGISVLEALRILEDGQYEFGTADTLHRQIEAIKMAMTDAAAHVTDPDFMKVDPHKLLSDAFIEKRRKGLSMTAAQVEPVAVTPSTVYLTAADRDGMMVSLIQSNYEGFGSGIVVPETGISLNNRLANFATEEGHVNGLAGGKRPYHTIIPGMLTREGTALGSFGVMGGFMQPQGHLQVLMNLLDFGMNPQAALDAPRFMWTGKNAVDVEDFAPEVLAELSRRGHQLRRPEDFLDMGRGQIILKLPLGGYQGGTEPRTDGTIYI
ncbi:MAG: gamma-glutamyltransferase family protein [Tissierellia bacterium]|nr:gamma-glutamyltransferase family protein [Tissierellia bacterium]